MGLENNCGQVKQTKRGRLRLRILAARHRKLHREKYKLANNIKVTQQLKSDDLQSFKSQYEAVFKNELVTRQNRYKRKLNSDAAECDPPTQKGLKIDPAAESLVTSTPIGSADEKMVQPASQRVWSSEKAELSSNFRNAERLRSVKSNEISSLRDKIAEQEFIMTESVFKYPRVPSSVSSNDVTPMNNSPIKPQDSKKAQENVFINKTDIQSVTIKQEPDLPIGGQFSQSNGTVADTINPPHKTSLSVSIDETVSSASSSPVKKDIDIISKSEKTIPGLTCVTNFTLVPPKQSKVSSPATSHVVSSVANDQAVVERITDLKLSGMLFSKRLPKVVEPKRCRTHWDYLLSEMVWMHTDFYQEHLWKLNAARVLADDCKKFLVVTRDPTDDSNVSHFLLPRDFIRRRRNCRSVASIVSSFWSDASKVLDIKQNLLDQENERQLCKLESESNSLRRANGLHSPGISGPCNLSPEKSLNRLNVDGGNDDIFVVATQLSADSDNSHISLGLDSAEMEKEVGHIMRMDDIFDESFIDASGDKFPALNKSPASSANSLPPIGWKPTPADHVASLELKFLAVEKYALSLIEIVYHGELLPLKDLNYESDENMLTIDRSMAEAEFCCVVDNEQMSTYFPPTPPIDDNDVYIDESMLFWYKLSPMKESQLPALPATLKKTEDKRGKLDSLAAIPTSGTNEKLQVALPPQTIFNAFSVTSNSALKSRSEVIIKRSQGITIPRPHLKSPNCPCKGKPVMQSMVNLDGLCEWLPNEDWTLVHGILGVMQLPPDLASVMPAIVTNWDFVSVAVNNMSRCFRSPKQSRARYEKYIKPREEGRTVMTEVKRKKQNTSSPVEGKNQGSDTWSKATKLAKTSHLLMQDMNNSATYVFGSKFDLIRSAASRRTKQNQPMQWTSIATSKNPRHVQSFTDCKINYDNPLTPQYLSEQRAIRLKTEKRNQNSIAGGSSKMVDALFSGQYTAGALKRSQSAIIAPRGSNQSASSAISIPTALCRQYSTQRKVAMQPSVSSMNNQQRNTIGYLNQSQSTGSGVRVIQSSGTETTSVAQKVTADYQRMILSNKQREPLQGTSGATTQAQMGQKQRIGHLVQAATTTGTGQSALGSTLVYNIATKGSAAAGRTVSGASNTQDQVAVGSVRTSTSQIAAKYGYIQPTGRSSIAAQLTAQSSSLPSANQIQMKPLTSSGSSTAASLQYGTNLQHASSPGSARYATTVVQRSATVKNVAQSKVGQIYSGAPSRVPATGNLSTAAQLLGRQAIRKAPSQNLQTMHSDGIGSASGSPRNSPIIVPATTQSYVLSQLQTPSSKQQQFNYSPASVAVSEPPHIQNIVPSVSSSSHLQGINSNLLNNTASVPGTAGRRSAFVQPLPSVGSLQSTSNRNINQNQK